MKRLYCVSFALLTTVGAFAQSISSFQPVTSVTGMTASVSGTALTVNLSPAPTFMYMSNMYTITDVFGAWALDDDDDMAATGMDQLGFTYHDSYSGFGGIAGWKTNPNHGWVGGTKVFNYTSLTGTVEGVGAHVRVSTMFPDGSDTMYIRGVPVPEPMSLTALGLGALATLRRRRTNTQR